MKLEVHKGLTHDIIYKLTISELEMSSIKLDKFDRRLVGELLFEESQIADKLLALELITRRIEEVVGKNAL